MGELLRKNFDCHLAAQVCVLSTIDVTHVALADFLGDLVMARGQVNHCCPPPTE